MLDSHVRGAHVYRSESGARTVRTWCEDEISRWTGLVPLPAVTSELGTTRAFRASAGAAGAGTPVVLLNGTNFNTASSVEPLRVLARDRPVISVDVPGQPGLSCGVRPRSPRTAAYGAWLDEVLPQLTDEPVIVLGHSLGAAIALAATPSELTRALMLVSPAGLTAAGLTPEVMRAVLPWMIGPRDSKSTRLLNSMSGPEHVSTGVHPLAPWMTLVARHCRTSLAPGPLTMECLRPWSDVPRIVATGSDDTFFSPARLHGPARRLLDTDVHVLEGAGHLALHECPERVAALLREFD
ncbi:alpha/beta hydrolase [Nocardiopsis sp. CNR-923]|uniref:alpha/beta fold hydrolase n=1 Tax=Nocardiopsis sp. CNR-923 TaxID=1904965 RepID=UPI0009680014|nr:alpha/beta hydrolase [Nocardiopsis sp. CNR-923]OLT28786.1 alpha/beta hydrolase [Nocardiopsis sp. CNR-923]